MSDGFVTLDNKHIKESSSAIEFFSSNAYNQVRARKNFSPALNNIERLLFYPVDQTLGWAAVLKE